MASRAFERIRSAFPYAHLLVIGNGSLGEDLEALAASLGCGNIHFLGFRKDMDEIMTAIDLFVLPSLTEGLPNVLLEAFAARKPVVATSVGGVPEVVDNNVNGFLCRPGAPEDLAEAIKKAMDQKDRLIEMGEMGYRKVEHSFSVESQTAALESIYNSLVAV